MDDDDRAREGNPSEDELDETTDAPTSEESGDDAGREHVLLVAIAAGAFGGGVLGWLAPETGAAIAFLGDLWLRALRMLVIPLIVTSMIHGVASLGDVRRLGGLGAATIGYYVCTSTVAITIGLVLVNTVEPGVGVDLSAASNEAVRGAEATGWRDMVESLVAPNLIEAAANTDVLPLILFSLAFGGALTTVGSKRDVVIDGVDATLQAVMKLVHLVMLAAPVGIFGLVAGRFGEAGGGDAVLETLAGLAQFALVVVVGLGAHAVIVLGLSLWLVARRSPLSYLRNLATAVTTAFATASSAATLPLTMNGVDDAGVDPRTARFVLPLGATVNMDGSALYEAVAALFIAQAYGIDVGLGGQVLIVLTAVLSSVGAAGIPEAGLVTMVIVLQAVGLPLEGLGLLLAIDWLLDRFRTAVNVWGDAVGAACLDRILDLEGIELEQGSG